jgi:DNA mismatch repair protein PMS2
MTSLLLIFASRLRPRGLSSDVLQHMISPRTSSLCCLDQDVYSPRRSSPGNNRVQVIGLISKFSLGCGRTTTDRQFFFINGRPCNPTKVRQSLSSIFDCPPTRGQQVQKAFNEVYRSFNTNQSPFVVADFILPTGMYQDPSCRANLSKVTFTDSCDINVSPDKRTILLHSEGNLIRALKARLLPSTAITQATNSVFTS